MEQVLCFSSKKNVLSALTGALLLLLTACGPTVNRPPRLQSVVIHNSFQSQETPPPSIPTYRCGAWASNNAPGAYSTIAIYAKLTQDITGVSGGSAKATAHLNDTDVMLDQQPISDSRGYVTFTLPLQGRQPIGVPTTIDVFFSVRSKTIQCTPAFFTPW